MTVRSILLLFLGFMPISSMYAVEPVMEKMVRYDLKPEQSFVLPTDFAGQFIVDQSALSNLKGKTIYHIELVYTAYKSSPAFDQNALNRNRVSELRKLLPQVISDNPSWSYIEQTGAKTAAEARGYFHGFVIHYSDDLSYEGLRDFFEDFQKSYSTYGVDNTAGGTYTYSSGSVVHIKAGSVTYADGTPVNGTYELNYREFRNPAEIALSGIPMTYSEKQQEYNFSSVGMYEIRAEQNGQELILTKPIEVDFNCTSVKPDVSFYSMSQSGEWKEIQSIGFNEQAVNVSDDKNVKPAGVAVNIGGEIEFNAEGMSVTTTHYKKYWLSELGESAWKNYLLVKAKKPEVFDDIVLEELPAKKQVKIQPETLDKFTGIIFAPGNHVEGMNVVMGRGGFEGNGKPMPNDKRSTLLAENADAGHTYPSLVKGLNSENFGVYNCDQIYRIGSPLALSPIYVDEATDREIANKQVACVIDLTYNGSFSFHPNHLMCNPDGRNVVLLFTSDKRVYMLSESAFAAMNTSTGRVEMPMTDVTAELKTTEDLKRLLNI